MKIISFHLFIQLCYFLCSVEYVGSSLFYFPQIYGTLFKRFVYPKQKYMRMFYLNME